jgi:hypothetical protein
VKRAAGLEGEIESYNCGDTDSCTGDEANELLIPQPAADKPIDGCAREWSKDDQTEKVVFHETC